MPDSLIPGMYFSVLTSASRYQGQVSAKSGHFLNFVGQARSADLLLEKATEHGALGFDILDIYLHVIILVKLPSARRDSLTLQKEEKCRNQRVPAFE